MFCVGSLVVGLSTAYPVFLVICIALGIENSFHIYNCLCCPLGVGVLSAGYNRQQKIAERNLTN